MLIFLNRYHRCLTETIGKVGIMVVANIHLEVINPVDWKNGMETSAAIASYRNINDHINFLESYSVLNEDVWSVKRYLTFQRIWHKPCNLIINSVRMYIKQKHIWAIQTPHEKIWEARFLITQIAPSMKWLRS